MKKVVFFLSMRIASKYNLREEYFDCSMPLFNELDQYRWMVRDGIVQTHAVSDNQ